MISILTIKGSVHFFFILLNIVLFLLCIYFYKDNKKLKEKIEIIEKENKKLLEKRIIKNSKEDLIPIQNISTETKTTIEKTIPKKTTKPTESNLSKDKKISSATDMKKVRPDSYKARPNYNDKIIYQNPYQIHKVEENLVKKDKPSNPKQSSQKAYQKNILQNTSKVTSPVSITNEDTFNMDKLSLDLNEFIKKSNKIVPKIKDNKTYVSKDYLTEIAGKMAEELKPQTIELTEYEQEQEDHAIISYQELLSIKDQIVVKDDEDGNIDFLEELKKFRNNLNE